MADLVTLLERYPDLSPEARAEVDARVAGRADLIAMHADARALAALVDAAAEPDASDDVLEGALATIDRRLGRSVDADLDDATAERVDALLDGMEDPVGKLERLTGLRLDATRGGAPPAPLRLVAPTRRRARWAPRLAAAAAALAVTYGGLLAVSSATVSERAQVSEIHEVGPLNPPALRSARGVATDARVQAALADVADARQSALGLFPSYDAERLAAAAADLSAALDGVDADSWVSQEGRLALGRVYLYLERDADAARVLGTLVAEGSYRASAARRLLDYVRAQRG